MVTPLKKTTLFCPRKKSPKETIRTGMANRVARFQAPPLPPKLRLLFTESFPRLRSLIYLRIFFFHTSVTGIKTVTRIITLIWALLLCSSIITQREALKFCCCYFRVTIKMNKLARFKKFKSLWSLGRSIVEREVLSSFSQGSGQNTELFWWIARSKNYSSVTSDTLFLNCLS